MCALIRRSGTQRPSVPVTLSDRDWSAPVRTLPSFGTVAGSPLLCQEAAPEWVLWARHVPVCCDYVTIANRILRRRWAMRRGAYQIWLAGVGRQAHRLDERHQDLIRDLGEQLIGRR